MKFTEKHIDWFDDYLSGNLDKKSQVDFEKLLLEDDAFCDEFESYKAFCNEIKESLQLQLLDDIKKGEETYFQKIRIRKITFLSLAVLCIIGIISVIFLQKKYSETTDSLKDVPEKVTEITISETPKSEIIDTQKNEFSNKEDLNAPKNNEKLEKIKSPVSNKIIESKQTIHRLVPYKKLELSQSGDTVIIKSNKEIKDFLSFEKNGKSYLKVGETLYYQTKEGFYLIEKDTRIAETIASASGKGKAKIIRLMLFEEISTEKTVQKEEKTESEIYFINDLKVEKEDFERLKVDKIFKIPTKVFTLEDLYNLNSN